MKRNILALLFTLLCILLCANLASCKNSSSRRPEPTGNASVDLVNKGGYKP